MSTNEPAVPHVDLPRVNAVQFQMYDHTVGAYLVTHDEDMARWIDALCSEKPGVVAADIETRGLDVNKFTITCVTVAFHLGGDTISLLLDPLRRPEHRGMITRIFDHAQRLIFHGAAFDIAPLYAHRLMTRAHIRKLGDTLVASRMLNTNTRGGRALENLANVYQLMNEDRTTMTEVFAARGLKKDEGWWATDIDTPTYVVGAMSDTVATLRLWGVPGVTGHGIMAEAAKYLTRPDLGFGGCGQLPAADAEKVVEDVQQVNAIILERTARGYAIDREFPERHLEQTGELARQAALTLKAAGIRPGVGGDLVKILDKRGELPQPWPVTPTGQLKADKKALEVFDNMPNVDSELVRAHQQVATSEKVRKYLEKVTANSGPTGRLHPEITVLGANATGRMCLPEDQQLFTRRGPLKVDEIRVGDETIDAKGNWVPVLRVHRYRDAEIRRYRLSCGIDIVCTPEHRWVTSTEYGTRRVRHLEGGERVRIELAPERSGLDFTQREFDIRTDGERFAAVVGILASDGRCTDTAGGMRGFIYQTEGGFYRQFISVIPPEAIMYDRITSSASINRGDHHEIQLRTRWLRPMLAEAGIEVGSVLSHSPSLVTWVAHLTLRECAEFLRAVWLSDGDSTMNSGIRISCNSPALREAVRVAAYRLGYRTTVRWSPASEWGTQPRATVAILKTMPGTRNMEIEDLGDADVWCVTTDSGTFTAWDSGRPYLTGNSASKPEVQQFPKEARGIIVADPGTEWISADWKSIEPVVMATASGDKQFLEDMRAGKDPYEPVGERAGVDRKLAKRLMLANMYGQGSKSAALLYGWDIPRAEEVLRGIQDGLPILYKLINALRKESDRIGHITTLTGRVLDQKFTSGGMADVAARSAANHFCQGSALDVMHYSILELDRRGLSDHVHLWMHDEIIADKEIQAELTEVMATPPPFLNAIAQAWGMEAFLSVDVNPLGTRWQYV